MLNTHIQDTAALQQMIFIVFAVGVFTGAICTGILNTVKTTFFNWVERPKRINTLDGFLYRYQNLYVPKEYREKLISDRLKKHKDSLTILDKSKILISIFFLIALIGLSVFSILMQPNLF
jgi:hypothetical protein